MTTLPDARPSAENRSCPPAIRLSDTPSMLPAVDAKSIARSDPPTAARRPQRTSHGGGSDQVIDEAYDEIARVLLDEAERLVTMVTKTQDEVEPEREAS